MSYRNHTDGRRAQANWRIPTLTHAEKEYGVWECGGMGVDFLERGYWPADSQLRAAVIASG